MKEKTTIRTVRMMTQGRPLFVFPMEFCDSPLLQGPYYYTAGVYGWNFDVYGMSDATVLIGYRGFPAAAVWVPYELIKEYDERARSIHRGAADYLERMEELRQELITEVYEAKAQG